MNPNTMSVLDRLEERIREWRLDIDSTFETDTSIVGFGRQGNDPVVLKVVKHPGDEWRSGGVLKAFAGRGVVQLYEQCEGAVLLERVRPGQHLAELVNDGRDIEATHALVELVQRMRPSDPPPDCATVERWAVGFDRYLQSGDRQIPLELAEDARRLYLRLCNSQRSSRLLHGDLHHDNVLFDWVRGWLAIDPKGVVGELEYEIGAMLRNPWGQAELFTSRQVISRRIEQFSKALNLDAERILQWGFAQAVLSAIWIWEDGVPILADHQCLKLAREIKLLKGRPLE
jgi:streptomycin 6-kinase